MSQPISDTTETPSQEQSNEIDSAMVTASARVALEGLRNLGCGAIVVGGAAFLFHGFLRTTTDVDFNVSKVPKGVLPGFKRKGQSNTVKSYESTGTGPIIGCDASFRWAENFSILERHTEISEDGVVYASLPYLLATKIASCCNRTSARKRAGDAEDISRLLDEIRAKSLTMPDELKFLYTADDWRRTKQILEVKMGKRAAMALIALADRANVPVL